MRLLGKPSGISLSNHVENVVKEGYNLIQSFPNLEVKYGRLTQGKSFTKRLECACKFHDEGKKHSVWQKACVNDFRLYQNWCKTHKGSFDAFKRYAPANAGKYLRKANIRHEIDSIIRHLNLPFVIQVAIGAHHGKLSLHHKDKWVKNPFLGEKGGEVWNKFNNENIKFTTIDFKRALVEHFEIAGIRGMLQVADVRASIIEAGKWVPDFTKFRYEFPNNWDKRIVQQLVESKWEDEILLVRAPTGAGKTDAALLWAQKQISNNRADRLIFAMPTRFTSNALSININESLSETGLYHSSAWLIKFHEQVKFNKDLKHVAKLNYDLSRKLLTPATVCTIDHLLQCLTLSREEHHTIAFNLANSCVVIDEADFYDDFTQANILVLLEALKEWKVPTMIMSASLPESSLKMYQGIGLNVSEIIEDDSEYDIEKCQIEKIEEYEKVEDINVLLKRCEKEPAIIYANTVAKAIEFYEWFILNTNVKPILYHSRYTEPDKEGKEKLLIESLGRVAWRNNTAKGVAILTQIGEMSVNISANLMISDVCPIDRLVQRIGRLNRFQAETIGQLFLLIPQRKGALYPAPYGNYRRNNNSWVSNPALLKTIDLIKEKTYTTREFVGMINNVYKEIQEFSVKARKNAKKLKEHFVDRWVILPETTSEIDSYELMFWKSRDIGESIDVLTDVPKNLNFVSYSDFFSYKIENAVSLPKYIVHDGRKRHKIVELPVIINETEETIYCAKGNVYTDDRGFFFQKDTIEDQFL